MIQVRNSVFETNSSSVHSLTFCTEEVYKQWQSGEVLFSEDEDAFITPAEAEAKINECRAKWEPDAVNKPIDDEILYEYSIYSWDSFWDVRCRYIEGFEYGYTTPGGERVIAFGYSGYDG